MLYDFQLKKSPFSTLFISLFFLLLHQNKILVNLLMVRFNWLETLWWKSQVYQMEDGTINWDTIEVAKTKNTFLTTSKKMERESRFI